MKCESNRNTPTHFLNPPFCPWKPSRQSALVTISAGILVVVLTSCIVIVHWSCIVIVLSLGPNGILSSVRFTCFLSQVRLSFCFIPSNEPRRCSIIPPSTRPCDIRVLSICYQFHRLRCFCYVFSMNRNAWFCFSWWCLGQDNRRKWRWI